MAPRNTSLGLPRTLRSLQIPGKQARKETCQKYLLFALFLDRSIFKVIALKEAMNNQEEPSALQLINDEENAELMFLLDAFNYQPADRPASRTLEEKLAMVSRTPTWTNIAYNKYFNQ